MAHGGRNSDERGTSDSLDEALTSRTIEPCLRVSMYGQVLCLCCSTEDAIGDSHSMYCN